MPIDLIHALLAAWSAGSVALDAKDYYKLGKWAIAKARGKAAEVPPDVVEFLEPLLRRLEEKDRERASQDEEIRARLRDIEEEVFRRVETSTLIEGMRESTPERKRMLAYFAAEAIDETESIDILSRMERAMRDVDPDDLLLLDELVTDQTRYYLHTLEHRLADERLIHLEFLNLAGCVVERIEDDPGGTTVVKVTQLGRKIHRHMRSYVAVRRAEGAAAFIRKDKV